MHFRSSPLMEWGDLRVFLAIARQGTLAGAARVLQQTQPTMGRRLRALEEALGLVLFQRTPDGMLLTDEGATVLAHAERMEAEALAVERKLTGQDAAPGGLLRLTSSEWFGATVLSPVLAEFGRMHPAVTIELLTDARTYSLTRRDADVAFRIQPFDEPEVISRRLMHVRYALYGLADTTPPSIGDGHETRVVTMDTAYTDMPDAAWLRRLLPNAVVAYRSNNRAVQASLCAHGTGVAVLPRPIGDATRGLVAIEVGETPPGRDTWLGYHRDLRRLPRLRALVEFVIARLAD